jgi:hypothetical protein
MSVKGHFYTTDGAPSEANCFRDLERLVVEPHDRPVGVFRRELPVEEIRRDRLVVVAHSGRVWFAPTRAVPATHGTRCA